MQMTQRDDGEDHSYLNGRYDPSMDEGTGADGARTELSQEERSESMTQKIREKIRKGNIATPQATGKAGNSKVRARHESYGSAHSEVRPESNAPLPRIKHTIPDSPQQKAILDDLQEKSDLLMAQNENLRRQNEDMTNYILELEKNALPEEVSVTQLKGAVDELRKQLGVVQRQREDIQKKYRRECEVLKKELADKHAEVENHLTWGDNANIHSRGDADVRQALEKAIRDKEDAEKNLCFLRKTQYEYGVHIEKQHKDLEASLNTARTVDESLQNNFALVQQEANTAKTKEVILLKKQLEDNLLLLERKTNEHMIAERKYNHELEQSTLNARNAKEAFAACEVKLCDTQAALDRMMDTEYDEQSKRQRISEEVKAKDAELERALADCETRIRRTCDEERHAYEKRLQKQYDAALTISTNRFKVEFDKAQRTEERLCQELADIKLENARILNASVPNTEVTDAKQVLEVILREKEVALAEESEQRRVLEAALMRKETALTERNEEWQAMATSLEMEKTALADARNARRVLEVSLERKESALTQESMQLLALEAAFVEKEAALAEESVQRCALEAALVKKEAALEGDSGVRQALEAELAEATSMRIKLEASLVKKEAALQEAIEARQTLEASLAKNEATLLEERLRCEQLENEFQRIEDGMRTQQNDAADVVHAELARCQEKHHALDEEKRRHMAEFTEAMEELAEKKKAYDAKFNEAMARSAAQKKQYHQKFKTAVDELDRDKAELQLERVEMERERNMIGKEREEVWREREEVQHERAALTAVDAAHTHKLQADIDAHKRHLAEEQDKWQKERAQLNEQNAARYAAVVAEKEELSEEMTKLRKQWQKSQRLHASLEAKQKARVEKKDESNGKEDAIKSEVREMQCQLQKERAAMMAELAKERADIMSLHGQAIAMALKDQENRLERTHEAKMEEMCSTLRSTVSTPVSQTHGRCFNLGEADSAQGLSISRALNSARGLGSARGLAISHASSIGRRIDPSDTADIDDSGACSSEVSAESSLTGVSTRKSGASQSSRTSPYRAGSPLSVLNGRNVPTPTRGPLNSARTRRPSLNSPSVGLDTRPKLKTKDLRASGNVAENSWTDHARTVLDCVTKRRQRGGDGLRFSPFGL